MSIDDRYIIDTPENIAFSYDIAGIGSRFLAAIIDTFILSIVLTVLSVVMVVVMSQVDDAASAVTSILAALWGLLSFVFLWGYYIFFELAWNGQSPGKRAVGLRVVREGGRPVTFVASAVRNLIRFIDFLPTFYGLGVLVMFIDRRARRLGDLAGGTVVVKEREEVSLEKLTSRADPLPALSPQDQTAPLLPNLSSLSTADYDLVQDFLRRRGDLGRASRTHLSHELANGMRARLGLSDDGTPPEQFLERIAHDYRVQQQRANQPVSVPPYPDPAAPEPTDAPTDPPAR